ncbi:MAG: hypothetical protein GTO46_08670 [Gemmatimonadetes bacterium]|nr:hypothetical protein [Gemmatimonadota bacterium]NIO31706.1 hypothetical protein [Gemmatimonadota bacterium]
MRAFLIPISACLILLQSSCARTQTKPGAITPPPDETRAILGIVGELQEAVNLGDAARALSLHWLEDARFSEIEDWIPEPFGAEMARQTLESVFAHFRPGDYYVEFTDIRVYLLAPTVAYATAIQDLEFEEPAKSRVTFVFLKQDDAWGIIHAHYSSMARP